MIIYNNEWMYTSFLPLDFASFNTTMTKSVNIVDLNTPLNLSCSAQAHPLLTIDYTEVKSVVQRTIQVNYACTPFNYFGDGQTVVIVVEVYRKYLTWLL